MTDLSLHLAPNVAWVPLLVLTLGALLLAAWAYGFIAPPLRPFARRTLTALRFVALALLLWLLAQPVLERAGGSGQRVIVLLDRSRSMDLPTTPGGVSRASEAARVVVELERAWRGRAGVEVLPFATTLAADTGRVTGRGATGLGDALAALATAPVAQRAGGVVVVSDGAVNTGEDPVAAARSLGLPVHTVLVGASAPDRAVASVEASARARVGEATPVRVRVTSSEARGTPIGVRLLDGAREIGRATVLSPGSGAEATAEFRITPARAGLAVWTAVVDSLAGEITTADNARQTALEVDPGRLGVLIVSGGLNWDLSFIRRALLGDSSLRVTTLVRAAGGWRALEDGARREPGAADVRGQAVVVLDAIAPAEIGGAFDQAFAAFVRDGGGLLALGGPLPGVARYRAGALGNDLAVALDPAAIGRSGAPVPVPEASEVTAWDDDPARGERAWRAAAPLADLTPVRPGAGDRVLIGSLGGGPPLLFARRVGRGQVVFVNGSGLWRWSLSSTDELSGERGRRLWRRLVRWLAEPVQGEPLRVRPERWLSAGGEPVRLFATLQDPAFKPVAGATVRGQVEDAAGRSRPIAFAPRTAGSYLAELNELPPGRYRVSVQATLGDRALGISGTEFAVDRWSLEEARTLPDSATLAAVAQASGGRFGEADGVGGWARTLSTRALARGRVESLRLWESPWVFVVVVGALGLEWAWRRRRGLP
ncbi:MAG: hypothetical protein A2W00_03265 [Candidatus Eisenbacteria bacterium RBG_16_71_46]|nr:MAG: hypothetical protein A2W00_03265 [Candidatus Eisenbacteria bacterium RBG_16_71_46]